VQIRPSWIDGPLIFRGGRGFLRATGHAGEDRAAAQAVLARRDLGGGCIPLPGLFCPVLLVHQEAPLPKMWRLVLQWLHPAEDGFTWTG
jgi:hypothetical protein